jgi:Mg-chelatase subunit ChlD
MPLRRILPWLLLPLGSVLGPACGSRTGLDARPNDASDNIDATDARDSGPDVETPEDSSIITCFTGSRAVGQIPIDLYFALDRSRSMDTIDRGATKTRYAAVSSAMTTFLNSSLSAGLGAGIFFFPRSLPGGEPYCSPADYAFPVVPIGLLPGVAASITKAISLQTRGAATPMTPALEGGHIYARGNEASHPDHTTAVVVVTDGAPRDCGSSLQGTAAVVATAMTGVPPIRTYVLGVGPNLDNLNTIAQAGGSSQAYLVESSGESSLLSALEAIRTSALACEFVLPGAISPTDVVRVSTRLGAGGATSIDPVGDADACAGQAGWFYDRPLSGGSSPPSKILLCPASCDPLVQSTGNHLDVTINCPAF